jgi:hypothetical protein
LTFSDAHVIGKLMPAALLRARASHIAAYPAVFALIYRKIKNSRNKRKKQGVWGTKSPN